MLFCMAFSAFLASLLVVPLSVLADVPASSISSSQWQSLNHTLGGKLYSALPLAAPCFSVVNAANVSVNSAACSDVEANYTDPLYRVEKFGAYMFPHWETCQSTAEKCLLDVTNTSNPLAWEDSTCFQGSVSPYYVDVQGASDVQATFAFAKDTGVRLTIKNSGHDYKGRASSPDSLGLWVHHLDAMSYDAEFSPESCNTTYNAMTIGGGVAFHTVYEFAEANNLTFIGGYHQTIAASGGWVQGGGHSILSPVYGLGADRVLQFKVVTPDGELRVANECQNEDLFWALRGGGGGTFGVVLESTHLVEPQMSLRVASISFTQTSNNSREWFEIVVNNSLRWGNEGWGGHIGGNTLIHVNPLLTLAEANTSMKKAVDFAIAQGGTAVIEELPSWYQFFTKYVGAAQAAVGVQTILGTRLIPNSIFENETSQAALVDVMVNMLDFANPYIVAGTPLLYNTTANATSYTPAWKDSLWSLGLHAIWQYNATVSEITTDYEDVDTVMQPYRDLTPNSGAYTNEGDVYEPDHEYAFWGDNYPALLALKQKYDPDGLLDCWMCVGWTGSQAPRYGCYMDI
ncbi:FAD-binding domain-containing protein [Stereum hirsutum FP-91666 SS1]|uniref:FAD-binding domain-containing protein n=1 Tax=Stereum hirsutum (strain FP-91666) TaxID=721885 RepID=UPI000440F981|nr:FAD-binding domain-containing protein [Stereum hirsutum FP-91666 SS1]EIM92699.1 FAD-binding domain-containing protein [Stereum hirsutum FP-91666 SS1]